MYLGARTNRGWRYHRSQKPVAVRATKGGESSARHPSADLGGAVKTGHRHMQGKALNSFSRRHLSRHSLCDCPNIKTLWRLGCRCRAGSLAIREKNQLLCSRLDGIGDYCCCCAKVAETLSSRLRFGRAPPFLRTTGLPVLQQSVVFPSTAAFTLDARGHHHTAALLSPPGRAPVASP